MRFAVEKCVSVLREYHSAVETITGYIDRFIQDIRPCTLCCF